MAASYTVKITITNPCGEGYAVALQLDPGLFAGQAFPDAIALFQFLKQKNLGIQQNFRIAPVTFSVISLTDCNIWELPLCQSVGALSYMYGIWYLDLTGQNQVILRFSEFFQSFLGMSCSKVQICAHDFCVQIGMGGNCGKTQPCPIACCPNMPVQRFLAQGIINDPFVQVVLNGPINNANVIQCRLTNVNLMTPQDVCALQCRCIQMENQLAVNIPDYLNKLQGRCQAQYSGPVRAKQACINYKECGEVTLNYDLFYVPCLP